MVDEPIAELLGDFALQRFNLGVLELYDLTAIDIDQMVVVGLGYFLVPRASVAEVVTVKYVVFLKEPDRSIDSGNADFRIDFRRAFVHQFDIRVIARLTQDARDDTPLARDFQAFLVT